MAEMNRLERWTVNRRTESRARRVLRQLGTQLAVREDDQVLELGCGAGGLVASIFDRFHPARIVGTDFDAFQVDAARRYLTRRWGSIPASVELRSADALSLPFPDSSFDLVFAMMMLHHVETDYRRYERRPLALAEIRRVLRPGGSLVYSDIFRRPEIRHTLNELGFEQLFLRSGWRTDLGIERKPLRSG